MSLIVNVVCVVFGILIGIFGLSIFNCNDIHDKNMESQHYEIYQEVKETKSRVIENSNKLDILLNIATNTLNRDSKEYH